MTDKATFNFTAAADAMPVGDMLARVASVRDPIVREAIEAYWAGKTVVLVADGQEIGRYPDPLQSTTLER